MTLFVTPTPFPVPAVTPPVTDPSENDAFGVAAVVVIEVLWLKSLAVTQPVLLRALAREDCIGAFESLSVMETVLSISSRKEHSAELNDIYSH